MMKEDHYMHEKTKFLLEERDHFMPNQIHYTIDTKQNANFTKTTHFKPVVNP